MINIVIADDHYLIREGFTRLLAIQPDMCVVAAVATAADLLECLMVAEIHVAVLDISLPDRSGMDVLKDLKIRRPRLPVLILSMHPEEHYGLRALQAGAAGYITKGSAAEELVHAIRKVHSGGRYVSESLAEQLAFSVGSDRDSAPHENLSDREFQVLLLMGGGSVTNEIAEALSISVNTVRTYRRRVSEKLGLSSIPDLVRYVLERQLLD